MVPLNLKKGMHKVMIKSAHRDDVWVLSARLVPAPENSAQSSAPSHPSRKGRRNCAKPCLSNHASRRHFIVPSAIIGT